MDQSLNFDEFSPSTYDDWKKRVLKELKDRPFDSLLVETNDGLQIEPGYTADHHGPVLAISQEEQSILFRNPADEWEIIAQASGTPQEINSRLLEGLMGGATAIRFEAPDSIEALSECLKGVLADVIAIHLICPGDPVTSLAQFGDWANRNGYNTHELRGSLQFDAALNNDTILQLAAQHNHWKSFRLFTVDGADFRNRGAVIAMETAIAIAEAHEILHELTEAGIRVDDASAMIGFRLGTGTDYFAEIARLRAFRFLWKQLIDAYQPTHACSRNAYLVSETSALTLGKKDRDTNLLRLTTEAMAAIVGGSNGVSIVACDEKIGDYNPTTARWSRNIAHLLREESKLNLAQNAASGSYFIETLSYKIAEQAWSIFLDIEQKGGFRAAEKWIEAKLNDQLSAVNTARNAGTQVWIGENKYLKQP